MGLLELYNHKGKKENNTKNYLLIEHELFLIC